nr:hypothetical protein CFP56_46634 [Quercus suber]
MLTGKLPPLQGSWIDVLRCLVAVLRVEPDVLPTCGEPLQVAVEPATIRAGQLEDALRLQPAIRSGAKGDIAEARQHRAGCVVEVDLVALAGVVGEVKSRKNGRLVENSLEEFWRGLGQLRGGDELHVEGLEVHAGPGEWVRKDGPGGRGAEDPTSVELVRGIVGLVVTEADGEAFDQGRYKGGKEAGQRLIVGTRDVGGQFCGQDGASFAVRPADVWNVDVGEEKGSVNLEDGHARVVRESGIRENGMFVAVETGREEGCIGCRNVSEQDGALAIVVIQSNLHGRLVHRHDEICIVIHLCAKSRVVNRHLVWTLCLHQGQHGNKAGSEYRTEVDHLCLSE